MSAPAAYEKVRDNLARLKLDAALTELDDILERAQKEEQLPVEVLADLTERELSHRFERRVQTNFRLAGIPVLKRIEEFDFEAQPGMSRRVVEELSSLSFLERGENVLLLGPCGVGKTHIGTGLCVRALERGHRVYFLTLHDLVTKARSAREKNRLDVFLRTIRRADLFCLDELGFLPLEPEDATCVFEAVNKRYQLGKSTIVTSNKSFGKWGEIFPDPVLATALLDRLLHHATTINIRGESYRLKNRRKAGLVPAAQEGERL